LLWSGKWAFSVDGFREGKASKFQLSAPLASATADGGGSRGSGGEARLPPEEAEFEGFFVMLKETEEGQKKAKIKESEVKVSFTPLEDGKGYRMHGSGVNKFGKFTLEGRLDSTNKKASCTKTYQGEDDAVDDGGSDVDIDIDADEVAEELADLKSDALEHGLVPAAELRRKRRAEEGASVQPAKKPKKKQVGDKKVAVGNEEPDGSQEREKVAEARDENGVVGGKEKEAPQQIKQGGNEAALWEVGALGAAEDRLKEAVTSGDEDKVVSALVALRDGGRISVGLLQATTVGKTVRQLRKSSIQKAAALASDIVGAWRKAVGAG